MTLAAGGDDMAFYVVAAPSWQWTGCALPAAGPSGGRAVPAAELQSPDARASAI